MYKYYFQNIQKYMKFWQNTIHSCLWKISPILWKSRRSCIKWKRWFLWNLYVEFRIIRNYVCLSHYNLNKLIISWLKIWKVCLSSDIDRKKIGFLKECSTKFVLKTSMFTICYTVIFFYPRNFDETELFCKTLGAAHLASAYYLEWSAL